MLLLKEFFRKKTTKIYFFLFTILFLGIIIFFSFAGYYENLYNDSIKKNSAFIMLSEKDHYEELSKSTVLFDIKRGLVFKPDYDYTLLGLQGVDVQKDGQVILKKDPIPGESEFFWEDFTEFDENIVIFKASDYNLSLNSGEIALGAKESLSNKNFSELLNKKLGFKSGEFKIEFTITDFYESPLSFMLIADEDFAKLVKYSSLYFYKASVKDLKKAEKLESKLRNLEKNNNYKASLCIWESTGDTQNVMELNSIVDTLKSVSYLIALLFIMVFYLLIKNIIKDETSSNMLKRMIGFTKWQSLKILFMQLLLLATGSFIISLFLAKISIHIINKKFLLKLCLNNWLILLLIYIFIIIIILINCLFNKSLKKIIRYS
mgnify:FL=1